MKILYVLNSGQYGGMEHHVLDLVTGIKEKGHDIYVWCAKGPMVKLYQDAGASVITAYIRFDIDPFYIFKLYKYIKINEIDIIHSNEPKASINALLASRFAGKKTITHTHTPMSEWQIANPIKKLMVRVESKFYSFCVNRFAEKEIALTESRKEVKIKEGINHQKLQVISNGLYTDYFVLDEKSKTIFNNEIRLRYNIFGSAFIIGNVGRMTNEKDHRTLIKAFEQVVKKYSNAVLFLAGGGELENELKVLTQQLKIANKVVFTGVFDQKDLIKYYSCFDIFAFTSLAEGFGLVLLEAMASSLPVVASDLEVLNEVGGSDILYFKAGKVDDLAYKLLKLMTKSKAELTADGKKLRDRVLQKYSMDSFVTNYNNLYASIIAR